MSQKSIFSYFLAKKSMRQHKKHILSFSICILLKKSTIAKLVLFPLFSTILRIAQVYRVSPQHETTPLSHVYLSEKRPGFFANHKKRSE